MTDELRGFLRAFRLAFVEADPNAETEAEWLAWVQEQHPRLKGVYDPDAERSPGYATTPVATFLSFDGTYNSGASLLDTSMITDVTVRPTHRRRGLLKALMTNELNEAKNRGQALCALTATDAKIYGRFGFGIASRIVSVEAHTGHDFDIVTPWKGTVHLVDPVAATETFESLFDAWHQTNRGSLSRPSHYRRPHFDWKTESQGLAFRAAVHYDEAGEADGAMMWRVEDKGEVLTVVDLVTLTPDAELGLWATIGGIELNHKVKCSLINPDSPLPWCVRDARVLKTVGISDHIWLRILDTEAVLAARGWERDGHFTLGVTDGLGHADGTFTIDVVDGRAQVTRTDAPAEAVVSVGDLASLYSGVLPAQTLHDAGRLECDKANAERLGELFGTRLRPYSLSSF